MKRWEIGSDFDYSTADLLMSAPSLFWLPKKYQLFSTATASILALKILLQKKKTPTLKIHVPAFYCMSLVRKLKTAFEVCCYRDLPYESHPDFATLRAKPGDLVIAVNLFGIKSQKPWTKWQQENQNVVLIEDHTHDPFSPWAKNSTADYAVSSLHKTLPIPDGGILWSPQNLALPEPLGLESSGANLRLTSMVLKRAYLNGMTINKEDYLRLSIDGQNQLDDESNSVVSTFTRNIFPLLNIRNFRQKRADNIRKFIHLSLNQPSLYWKPLFETWAEDTVPFNSIIICQSPEIRDSLRQYLISSNIFPAIHWRQPYDGVSFDEPDAIALSEEILTIPTDQRYDLTDIFCVFKILNQFTP
ncbi:hypothetical protein Xen7305DRAFT_00035870 [Xenococcus sp. PCC 7305]|uniref:hypothetical protein n=1 Tax=Xenococcus sp. PCC 7305 TaxID=102125 RepID=UPI0002AC584B|nr:hypothetical protein [Xenococcus sp. PCC 7305]ELS03863.1 hypothetical protein Xen7305DRAFT_00035870 [Xenococcus sp. PCC 7305]